MPSRLRATEATSAQVRPLFIARIYSWVLTWALPNLRVQLESHLLLRPAFRSDTLGAEYRAPTSKERIDWSVPDPFSPTPASETNP
jgi:hypothetical protein